ncbi:hypothetical protein ACFFGT_10050 [Mucilaginibacter angelicae]|uniref:Deaminase of polymorphic toxin system n=1 Tax=Mucilaginibacter angelicae TaxID=869718 RepID=A0ABV6L536_9SPHI
MKVAILKTDGVPVYIDSFSEPIIYDVDGFLVRFGTNEGEYRYHQPKDFRKENRERDGLEGYYLESKFKDYLKFDLVKVSIEDMLNKYKYDFSKTEAHIGDIVNTRTVDYGAPYEYYYKEKEYTFNLTAVANSLRPQSYKKGVYEDLKVVGHEISVPPDAPSVEIEHDLNHTPPGFFYWKNFGSNVNNWTIGDAEKRVFKKIAVLLSFRIKSIIDEIFPLLLTFNEMAVVDAVANDPEYDLNSLSDLGKAVFLLKRGWGCYYDPSSSFEQRQSFDPVFSNIPVYSQYVNYYQGLVGFYDVCYALQDELKDTSESGRLNFIIRMLSSASIAIFPFKILKYLLEDMCQNKVISDSNQDFIVSIVSSIKPEDYEQFLDFLIDGDGVVTRFECLYMLLSDNILGRMLVPDWLVENQTYRKVFVFSVYGIWKQSKYNFTYIPPGVTPVLNNLNPQSYFFVHPEQFNQNNVLTFESKSNSTDSEKVFSDITFTSVVENTHIKITKVEEITRYIGKATSMTSAVYTTEDAKLFGSFHLYQTITFAGYQVNLEFSIPQKASVPAFLFHYVEEYDKLSDFDAKIALGVNIAVDLMAFFLTGGLGVLEDLSYLRYISKVGQAMEGLLPATEAVEVWRGLEAGGQVITLSASTLVNFNQYLITEEHDPQKRTALEKMQQVFLSLMIISGTASHSLGKVTAEYATEVLDLYPYLPPGTISDDLKNLLSNVKGDRALATAEFGAELNQLDMGETNHIIGKYIPMTEKDQFAFKNAFEDLNNESWIKLNRDEGIAIDYWFSLYTNGFDEASNLDFITSTIRYDAIQRFSEYPAVKQFLNTLPINLRIEVLTKFADANAFDSIALTRLDNFPMACQFLSDAAAITRTGKDVFTVDDIIGILKSNNLNDAHVGTIVQRNKLNIWLNVFANFKKIINVEYLSLEQLRELTESYVGTISGRKPQEAFKGSNRLFITIGIYQDDVLVQPVFTERFFSGNEKTQMKIMNASPQIKNDFVEINFSKYNDFSIKAFDHLNRSRIDDTETKAIFHFIENHYSKGNRFVITMNSALYTCPSCQRYLQAFVNQATLDGKIIEVTAVSHPLAISFGQVTKLLK